MLTRFVIVCVSRKCNGVFYCFANMVASRFLQISVVAVLALAKVHNAANAVDKWRRNKALTRFQGAPQRRRRQNGSLPL